MRAKREVVEGAVYYPKRMEARYAFRRVVGIVADRVFYSVGDKALDCSLKQFLKVTKGEAA